MEKRCVHPATRPQHCCVARLMRPWGGRRNTDFGRAEEEVSPFGWWPFAGV